MGKPQKILGIDPGLDGGVAQYDGYSLSLIEIPTEKAARGRIVLWDNLAFLMKGFDPDAAYIEQVSTRPGEGRVSAFKFGYIAGGLRGIIAQAAIPTRMVTPRKWKSWFGLGSSKEEAVAHACSLFPEYEPLFFGPRGGIKDGLAEAALIAFYGRVMEKENGFG